LNLLDSVQEFLEEGGGLSGVVSEFEGTVGVIDGGEGEDINWGRGSLDGIDDVVLLVLGVNSGHGEELEIGDSSGRGQKVRNLSFQLHVG